MTVSLARDEGILKRVRGTPLPGWAYLVARMLQAVLVAVLLVVIVAVVGRLFFGVRAAVRPAAAAGRRAGRVGRLVLRPGPGHGRPHPERRRGTRHRQCHGAAAVLHLQRVRAPGRVVRAGPIGNLFPIRHLANALQSVWNPVVHPFDPVDLVWIARLGMLLGLVVAAMRTFTWEPRA